jgi:thiol-disulfide isomerase/thioredoxin
MKRISAFLRWTAAGVCLLTALPAGARAIQPESYAPAMSPKVTRPALPWGRDLESAQRQARAEQKRVLVSFVGSDWCGWCLRMRREVFAKPEFQGFAQTNLVLVEVDFPRDNRQSATQRETNATLARRFGVTSVPTLVLLDGSGRKVRSWGFEDGGARHYLAEFRKAAAGPEAAAVSSTTTNEVKSSTATKGKASVKKVPAKSTAKPVRAPKTPPPAATVAKPNTRG